MYVDMHMSISVCVCVCMCVYIYICIYIHVCRYAYVYIYDFMYVCVYACMYACMYVCTYVCLYIRAGCMLLLIRVGNFAKKQGLLRFYLVSVKYIYSFVCIHIPGLLRFIHIYIYTYM